MQNYYLIGSPIAHSKSPAMMNTSFSILKIDAHYGLREATVERAPAVVDSLREENAAGWNITMPCKEIMAALCDELATASRIGGSVNTVKNINGRLFGYTTDGIGFVSAIRSLGTDVTGKKIVLLGTGGAASAILIQAALEKAAEIAVFFHRPESGRKAAEMAEKLSDVSPTVIHLYRYDAAFMKKEILSCDILVNATNVGMDTGKAGGASCLIPDASFLASRPLVYDIIYHPAMTPLLQMADAAGCRTGNGLSMLLGQGAASFKIWTGCDMPEEQVLEKVFR